MPAFKKKTEQVYRTDDTPEERKRNLLRYEETLPWHLEDDDNKNVWVGTYEEALSEKYILLLPEEGRFRMVPVEKIGIQADVKEMERSLALTQTRNNEHQVFLWTNGGTEMLYLYPQLAIPVIPMHR